MKVLLVVLAITNNYKTESDFWKGHDYTLMSACEKYEAYKCELRHETVLAIEGGAEVGAEKWSLWGIKK